MDGNASLIGIIRKYIIPSNHFSSRCRRLFAQFFVLWCNFLFVFNAKGVLRLQWWRIRACCNFFRGRWIFSKKLVGSCLATARCLFSFFFLTVRRNCSCTKNMAIFDVVLFFLIEGKVFENVMPILIISTYKVLFPTSANAK
jgi:hypothetical protein